MRTTPSNNSPTAMQAFFSAHRTGASRILAQYCAACWSSPVSYDRPTAYMWLCVGLHLGQHCEGMHNINVAPTIVGLMRLSHGCVRRISMQRGGNFEALPCMHVSSTMQGLCYSCDRALVTTASVCAAQALNNSPAKKCVPGCVNTRQTG